MVTTTSITVLGARTLPGGPPSGCLCLLALPQGNRSELSYQKALFAIYRMFEGKLSVRITWAGGSLTFFFIFLQRTLFPNEISQGTPICKTGKSTAVLFEGEEGCHKAHPSASSSPTPTKVTPQAPSRLPGDLPTPQDTGIPFLQGDPFHLQIRKLRGDFYTGFKHETLDTKPQKSTLCINPSSYSSRKGKTHL